MGKVGGKRASIRTYLIAAFAVITGLPLASTIAVNASIVRTHYEEEYAARIALLAGIAASGAETFLEPARRFLDDSLEAMKAFAASGADPAPFVESMLAARPYVASFQVAGPAGVIEAAFPRDDALVGVSVAEQDYFRAAGTPGKPTFSRSFVYYLTGGPAVVLSERDPVLKRTAMLFLDLGELDAFVAPQLGAGPFLLYVADRGGTLLFSPDPAEPRGSANIGDILAGARGEGTFAFERGGAAYRAYAAPVADAGWTVVAAFPARLLDEPVARLNLVQLLAWAAIALIAAAAAFFFLRAILRPIDYLRRTMERVRAGDYGAIAPAEAGFTDFRRILEEFAGMREAVREREGALQGSLRQSEVLLKELHHRVKNNLQVIMSLLNLQIGELPDPGTKAALRVGMNRIHALALVHEKLYQSRDLQRIDLGDYLRGLGDTVCSAFETQAAVDFVVEAEPCPVSIDQAIPLGLIANELISNSFKYAFEGRARGLVYARLRRGADGGVILAIGDDGRGLSPDGEGPRGTGLGLQITRALADQLDARLETRRPEGGGTEHVLHLPRGVAGADEGPRGGV